MMMDLKNKIEKVMFPETSGKIDRYMMEEMHIPGIILMERAASGIAQEIIKEFPAGGKAAYHKYSHQQTHYSFHFYFLLPE